MRVTVPIILVGILAIAGCISGPADPEREGNDGNGNNGDERRLPDLPPGTTVKDGREVERTRTSVTFLWEGTAQPFSEIKGVTGQSAAPATLLELGALVPLHVTFAFEHGSFDEPSNLGFFGLTVRDEYGRHRCFFEDAQGIRNGESCEAPWVRPTGAVRSWPLRVYTWATDDLDVPFKTTVTVSTLPYDGPVDPRGLASLSEIKPFEATSDGVALRGHVYMPDGDGPFPTVLEFSPYWNNIVDGGSSEGQSHETPDGRTTLADRLGKFLDHGYAVALINMRGTGESDGCQTFFGPQDGTDAYHVIQTLASQPWSNGNVGMTGLSWPAYSQYAALREQPPALKAIVASSAILDQWTLWTRHGPAIVAAGPPVTTYAYFMFGTTVGFEGDFGVRHLPCPEYLEQAQAFNDLSRTGDDNPWLQERDMHDVIANSTVPMFVTNGLHQGEGHKLQVDGLWELMPDEKRLLLGQWAHAFPYDSAPGIPYHNTEMKEVWDQQVLDFLGHHLKGEEKRLETGIVEYEDTSGTWRTASSWPPPGKTERLYLSDGTLVASAKDVVASRSTFVTPNVPSEFTPEPARGCGYTALYVSPPLEKDVFLAGNFLVNVTVSATAPNGNFAVLLYHGLDPQPCTYGDPDEGGPLEIGEVRRAVSDLRHRGHRPQGTDFPAGSSDVMEMRSYPFAEYVPAGHRLMLVVAGTDPEIEAKSMQPAITVETGSGITGELTLNVVEGNLRFKEGGSPGSFAWVPSLGLG